MAVQEQAGFEARVRRSVRRRAAVPAPVRAGLARAVALGALSASAGAAGAPWALPALPLPAPAVFSLDQPIPLTIAAVLLVALLGVVAFLALANRRRRLAEAALRANEQKLSAILNQTFQFTALLDCSGTVLTMNETALHFGGFSAADAAGKPLWETPLWYHSAEMQRVAREAVARAAGGETVRLEATHRDARRQLRVVDVSIKPIRDPGGRISSLLAESRDVTDQKQFHEMILNTARGVSAATGETFFRSLVEHLGRTLDAHCTFVAELLPGEEEARTIAVYCNGAFEPNFEYALRGTPCATVLATGTCAVTRGVQQKFPDHQLLRTLGTDGYVGACLRDSRGKTLGLMVVLYRQPVPDADLAESMLRIFATRAAAELERTHAEESLRASEQRLRTIIDHAQVVLWAVDRNGVFTFSEGLGLAAVGLKPGQVVGQSLFDLYTAYPEIGAAVRRALLGEPSKLLNSVNGVCFESHYGPIRDGNGAIVGAIGCAMDVTERVRAEESRLRLAKAVEQAAEDILLTDVNGVIEYANPAFERITGYTRDEVVGKTPAVLKSGVQDDQFYRNLWSTIKSGRVWTGRFSNRRKDGTLIEEEATISPIFDAAGRLTGFVSVKRDVTDQVRIETQLRQAQKMEAVGRLAGGVAHDFNNLLSPIIGYADLLLGGLTPNDPRHEQVSQIRVAADRARGLTQQLLAFGRKQVIEIKTFRLADVITGFERILRGTIREDIDVQVRIQPGAGPVRADPSQMEQVLMNLALNAQDAMPQGGTMTIEVAEAEVDEAFTRDHNGFAPGSYLLLAVSDTGTGMRSDALEHLFEPFFTTKERGRGMGLGLATVYGIVKQHGGHVLVDSRPGKGTSVRIYLPRSDEAAATGPAGQAEADGPRGTEAILVVEDNAMVRTLACTVLKQFGYKVFSAATAKEAADLFERHAADIRLLLTDVVMPGMNGRQLFQQFASLRPELRVLYMSGYTEDVIAHHGVLEKGVHFVQKPFSVGVLTAKVRAALDSPAG